MATITHEALVYPEAPIERVTGFDAPTAAVDGGVRRPAVAAVAAATGNVVEC